MLELLLLLSSAWLLGLLGSVHCIGMCGGFVTAMCQSCPKQLAAQKWMLAYHAGRITTYALLGAMSAWLGVILSQLIDLQGGNTLRLLAGVLMVLSGFYVAGWQRSLSWLERGGQYLWRPLAPLTKKLLPIRRPAHAFVLGSLWGLLPCGLIYNALIYALSCGSWHRATLVMIAFGIGTLPALLLVGTLYHRLKHFAQQQSVRYLAGLVMMLFGMQGVWLAYMRMVGGVCGHL